jgi:tripartite-type tricarboxylate transporter receptor subunit TctC
LVPVACLSNTVIALRVPASLNVNSLKELEALARRKPGQLNWTTATGATDFVFAGFLHSVGLTMAKVPYKNPVTAATDLAEGRIQVYMPAYAIVRPQVLAGKADPGGHQSRARPGVGRNSDRGRGRLSIA